MIRCINSSLPTMEYNRKYFVISKYSAVDSMNIDILGKKVSIIIYLFYEDMLDRWTGYINGISSNIECIIISSNEALINKIREDNLFPLAKIIKKPNTGRDVSALLIAAKSFIQKSDYVCFVHDKKEHQNYERIEETELWISNIWENTIASADYIKNVIDLFELDEKLGVLTVPDPIGVYFDTWAGQGWYGTYEATKRLAETLKLNCVISSENPPNSLSTVLWFRTKAMKKLIEYEWTYDVFDDTRLSDKNYISYAVERIFPYVADDAGYDTATIMTAEYAEIQSSMAQNICTIYANTLSEFMGITTADECVFLRSLWKQLDIVCEGKKNIYIYGAGHWGRIVLKLIRLKGKEIKSFIVTKRNEMNFVDFISVSELVDVGEIFSDDIIIIAIKDKYVCDEIKGKLSDIECECYSIC